MNAANAIQESLEQKGYLLTEKFSFLGLAAVVREGFAFRNIFIKCYITLLAGITLFVIAAGSYLISTGQTSLSDYLAYFFTGVLSTFLIIPLHEFIHGCMFKYYGARDVRYGFIPKYLMFYAVAHLFTVTYIQFRRIALAPFIIISSGCIIAILLLPLTGKFIALGLLLFHTFCCAGDFGLCAYMFARKEKEIISFDDANEQITYFFCKY
ncbi:DUF3267 domain-containing protein [Chitinophaga defluvii]|uniref:DUF3267 domain-containing protein n=1 Tax=Chitinophaga defluvii TaxID=3163343 RepID=A0ABV2T622_9BACT